MSWARKLINWRWYFWRPTDYASVVERLTHIHDLDEAMELAVGGHDALGDREFIVLDHFGLRDGHYLIDVGCGSGRLTRRVARLPRLRYLGTDINKSLLDYARANCGRDDFRFAMVDRLTIPERDNVADVVAFFSVGTHLLNEQFFVYLEEARRVLRPGGRIVFSFLDVRMPSGRRVFENMVWQARAGKAIAPLNVFSTPDMVRVWARMLDMTCVDIVDANKKRLTASDRVVALLGKLEGPMLFGQSIAVLEKPMHGAQAS